MSSPRDPVADLSELLDQLTGAPDGPPESPPPLAVIPAESDADPVYPHLDAFVREYFARVVERRVSTGAVSGMYWCPRWWAHPEAISRLYALWRAWETLRVADPQTGMSTWWLHHADPHLAALSSEYGAFSRCRPDKHIDPAELPVEPAPDDVLDQLPDGQEAPG